MANGSGSIASLADLEADIHDLTLAAEIAFDAAMDAQIGGKALFAIEQFERITKSLNEKFHRIAGPIRPTIGSGGWGREC
jgi:hypothetical protein